MDGFFIGFWFCRRGAHPLDAWALRCVFGFMIEILSIIAGVVALLIPVSMLIPTRGGQTRVAQSTTNAQSESSLIDAIELNHQFALSAWSASNYMGAKGTEQSSDLLQALATKVAGLRKLLPKSWLDTRSGLLSRDRFAELAADADNEGSDWAFATFKWNIDSEWAQKVGDLIVDRAYRTFAEKCSEQMDGYGISVGLSDRTIVCAVPVAKHCSSKELLLYALRFTSSMQSRIESEVMSVGDEEISVACLCKFSLADQASAALEHLNRLCDRHSDAADSKVIEYYLDENWHSTASGKHSLEEIANRKHVDASQVVSGKAPPFLNDASIETADPEELSEALAAQKKKVAAMGIRNELSEDEKPAVVTPDLTTASKKNAPVDLEARELPAKEEPAELEDNSTSVSSPDEIEALFARAKKHRGEEAAEAPVNSELDKVEAETNESIEELFNTVNAAKAAASDKKPAVKAPEIDENVSITPDDIAALFEAARGQ